MKKIDINEQYGLNTENLDEWIEKREGTGGLVYIAGDLFSKATIEQRKKEGALLKSKITHSVFNPITDNSANDKVNKYAKATEVFSGDTEVIATSSVVMAELDREDVGVVAELGVVYGMNFILSHIEEILKGDKEQVIPKLRKLLNDFPIKQVVSHYSDIRFDSANKYHLPTASLNHYFLGMLEAMGAILVRDPEEAIDYISCRAKGDTDKMEETLKKSSKLNGCPTDTPLPKGFD